MKNNKLIMTALRGKDRKSYTKLCKDCEVQDGQYLELDESMLQELTSQPFDSIGMELEKHLYESRTLYLNDEVTAELIDPIVMLIHKWNYDDGDIPVQERMPIVIHIDTHGGDLAKATTLVSAIENSVTPVVGYAEGVVMSAGLWIFLACHYRIATRHSDFMYHELRASSGDMSTLQELQTINRYYERTQLKIDKYIVERTELKLEFLQNKRRDNVDWFISIEEVEKYGFADEIL